jgi:hypothetical protein
MVGAGESIPPLYYEAAEGCEAASQMYIANIHETILHRYLLREGNCETSRIEMFYKTQALDSTAAVAKFYFGPLAPASVILNANPEWGSRFGKDPWFRLPSGTLVRIPLPADWIIKFYE